MDLHKNQVEKLYPSLMTEGQALRIRIQALDECMESLLKLLERQGGTVDTRTVEDALTVVHTVWLDVQREVLDVRIELAILLRALSNPEPVTPRPLNGVHSRSYTGTRTDYTEGDENQ
jgi:hypothetical protein